MTRRVLAVILMLVAGGTSGCRGGERSALSQSIGEASPHTSPPPHEVVRVSSLEASPATADALAEGFATGDIVQFSQGGMIGQEKVNWDPQTSSLLYESSEFGKGERWRRQPSPEEWRRFWIAMDAAGVWGWKPDYGNARQTDCGYWSLTLKHGSKRISSGGCSLGPDEGSFLKVVEELTRLRGEASVASRQALELAKRLTEKSDWSVRMETVRTLGAMGSAAGAAGGALVDLLDAAPISMWRAAPGPEPVVLARSVQPLLMRADRAMMQRNWDEAIDVYDRVLARDPQNESAARGRSDAIAARRSQRYRAERAEGFPDPPSAGHETAMKEAKLADAAALALVQIGQPAVPALVHGLEDRNPNRRRRVADTLGDIGTSASSAIPALTLGLKDPAFQQTAALALVRVDRRRSEMYVPLLIKGLDARDPDVARLSAAALAEVGTAPALPGLIHALDDERTHRTAMIGIYRMGPRAAAAIPSIIATLLDGREAERQLAASTLAAMGPTAMKAIPALIDSVRNDRNGGVRENAAQALGAMGPVASEAVPALVNNLRYGDPGYQVATGAAMALGQIGLPAIPALTAALKCDHLGAATPISPTGYLGPVYAETENVRVYAANALLYIKPPARDAIPALTESLRDPSPRVREAAAHTLKSINRR